MAKTIKLVSNNGLGWSFGDAGTHVVEIATEHGFGWSAKSASAPVAPPLNTVLPTITGTPKVGETLTATPGTWTGSPAPTYAYQWRADGDNIDGATSATYVPVEGDVGMVISVEVTATNSSGSEAATSDDTAPVEAE